MHFILYFHYKNIGHMWRDIKTIPRLEESYRAVTAPRSWNSWIRHCASLTRLAAFSIWLQGKANPDLPKRTLSICRSFVLIIIIHKSDKFCAQSLLNNKSKPRRVMSKGSIFYMHVNILHVRKTLFRLSTLWQVWGFIIPGPKIMKLS